MAMNPSSDLAAKKIHHEIQMKQLLRQTYCDLSNGKLSQEEALEKIKSIKLQRQSKKSGPLSAVPVWRTREVEVSARRAKFEFTEHHVMVSDLGQAKLEA